jgi:hypothetical protein
MPSWDRQPGESEIAYEAFKAFLALEGKRSGNRDAKQLKKTQQLINRWASHYKWHNRARDYDNERGKMLLATEIAEEKKRRRKVAEREHETGVYFESTVRKALARLNERMDNDPDFLIQPKDITVMTSLGYELQKTEFQEHADEQSGKKGMLALAESIRALADKTIEDRDKKRSG